ncbi:MAG: dolichol-phosphate mannosyltransferase [Thermoleophilaceae bacterium]|nr:dolichol-phosphate mannosyltransferase [Thermoleophilaceae bacterium]
MKLSVVIPARNEEGTIESAVRDVVTMLRSEGIDHEVIVVDDHSSDRTAEVVAELGRELGTARCIPSPYGGGFGLTVRAGLEDFTGDAVAILMADGSDDPRDLVRYYRILMQGYDCAFGSRFMPGSEVRDYPKLKLAINRVVNLGIRLLFRHGYNDTTNAFKAYRREVIDNIQPLLSNHFNLTVEMPLKAIIRGHSYAIVPISWTNRTWGESKLALQEMGSRYLFSLLYAFLEDHLTRGDYRRPGFDPRAGHGRAPVLRLEDQPPEPVDLESRAAARGRFSR